VFESVGDAALQAENSEAVIRKHYLDLKSVDPPSFLLGELRRDWGGGCVLGDRAGGGSVFAKGYAGTIRLRR
jgi:hypothetical protein